MSLPRVCVACGHDRAAASCGRCLTDSASATWTRAGPSSLPRRSSALGALVRWVTPARSRRFEFDDRTLDIHGQITVVGERIVEGCGDRRFVHAVRGPELPAVARMLSSRRMVPIPLEIESAPSPSEVVRGAFVCALLGVAARGALDLAFDAWVRWERRGPFVLSGELERRPSVWLRKAASAPDLELPPLERALLEGLAHGPVHGGYRSHVAGWISLDAALGASRPSLPSPQAICDQAVTLDHDEERVLEDLELAAPRMMRALAGSAFLVDG